MQKLACALNGEYLPKLSCLVDGMLATPSEQPLEQYLTETAHLCTQAKLAFLETLSGQRPLQSTLLMMEAVGLKALAQHVRDMPQLLNQQARAVKYTLQQKKELWQAVHPRRDATAISNSRPPWRRKSNPKTAEKRRQNLTAANSARKRKAGSAEKADAGDLEDPLTEAASAKTRKGGQASTPDAPDETDTD